MSSSAAANGAAVRRTVHVALEVDLGHDGRLRRAGSANDEPVAVDREGRDLRVRQLDRGDLAAPADSDQVVASARPRRGDDVTTGHEDVARVPELPVRPDELRLEVRDRLGSAVHDPVEVHPARRLGREMEDPVR